MSETINELLKEQGTAQEQPPLIVLGQFERVGSTFYLDELEKTRLVHNEPYKLLVPPSWPISRKYDGALTSVDEFFEDPNISEIDKHWLRNLVASLHHPGSQVIKETNLYLALPQFLELFPSSRIQLLTRNPLGIVSSFKRNNLYERWRYESVAQTIARQLAAGRPENYQAMQHMIAREGDWSAKLMWMIGLNAVLLSRHVEPPRVSGAIAYERDVIPMSSPDTVSNARVQDSIFATNIHKVRDDFESRFTTEELTVLCKTMEQCAGFVTTEFDACDQRWLNELFTQHLGAEYVGTEDPRATQDLGRVSVATETLPLQPIRPIAAGESAPDRKLIQLQEDLPLLWSRALVTNRELGAFMQSLLEHGHDPALNYLLMMDDMPPARGGRIVYDAEANAFNATQGFDSHPAYWITWLTASLYAYQQGMRLPTWMEWRAVYDAMDEEVCPKRANHSYAFDDTVPTGNGSGKIPYDFFGNLKIWCSDWSNEYLVSKKLAGISWKHYMHDAYNPEGERPYLTNSRAIGARLVCCSKCPCPGPRSTACVKQKLDEIVGLIHNTRVKTAADLRTLNASISDALIGKPCPHAALRMPKELGDKQ